MTSPTRPAATKTRYWVILNLESHVAPTGFIVQSATRPQAKPGQVVEGPFDTRAQAEASLHGPVGPGPPPVKLPNPLSWLGGIAHWLGDAILHITDVHMWISLGWLLLGALLLIWGILLWARIPQRAAKAGAAAAGLAL